MISSERKGKTKDLGSTQELCDGADNDCDGKVDEGVCHEKQQEPSPPDEKATTEKPAETFPIEKPLKEKISAEMLLDAGTQDGPAYEHSPKEPSMPEQEKPSPEKDNVIENSTSKEAQPQPEKTCRGRACPCKDNNDCPTHSFCTDGSCKKTCHCRNCPSGEVCSNDTCQPDKCAKVTCNSGKVCVPDIGKCVENPCSQIICPKDSTCKRGQCFKMQCNNGAEEFIEKGGEDVKERGDEHIQSTEDTEEKSAPEEKPTLEEKADGGAPLPIHRDQETRTPVNEPVGCSCSTQDRRSGIYLWHFLLLFAVCVFSWRNTHS